MINRLFSLFNHTTHRIGSTISYRLIEASIVVTEKKASYDLSKYVQKRTCLDYQPFHDYL
jgi:hypothetical protein